MLPEVGGTHDLAEMVRLRFDRFVVDRSDERVFAPDGPLRIGQKAYRVLNALINNNGRLLTKDELFETVWDGTHVSESALTSVIKELRRALGDTDKPARLIESVYGRGYRILADVLPAEQPSGPSAARPAPQRADEIAIAVLAFDNRSDDEDLAYFSDGVSEEILYTIGRAPDLRVIGKASSFQFRGTEKSAAHVAEKLGATHVLDGSVRRAGDSIRIHVELVDTASLETLWAERYDRALTDVFALQDEIAASVAAALKQYFAQGAARAAVDPAAYDLYLRARSIFTEDSSWRQRERCAALLEGAVAADPGFARAWGLLSAFRRGDAAVEAAERGLALDPECANALAALSFTKTGADQHAERLRLIERAYAIEPDDSFVSSAYLAALLSLGLLSRALAVAEAKLTRDPLSPIATGFIAFILCYAGRTEEAMAYGDKLIERQPNSDYARYLRGALAIYAGDLDRAEAIAATMSSKNRVNALMPPVAFIRTMSALDQATRARRVGEFLRRNAPTCYLLDVGLASIVGEGDAAMHSLLSALAHGDPVAFTADNDGRDPSDAWITVGLFVPAFRPLRFDPRFAEICVRMGLYDCWAETGQWPDCIAEVAPVYDLRAALGAAARQTAEAMT